MKRGNPREGARVYADGALGGQYKLVVKVAEKRWFNGTRLSPHIFNTERLPVRLALEKSLWCR